MRTVLIAMLALFVGQTVYAAGSSSIAIKPLNKDGEEVRSWLVYPAVKPGAVIKDSVVVSNASDKPVTILVYMVDAKNASDGGYAPNADDMPVVDLGSWAKLDQSEILLAPNEEKIVNLTIKVPMKVVPGDHAATVLVRKKDVAEEAGKQTTVKVIMRMGLRIYLTVDGPVLKEFKFAGFRLEKDASGKPYMKYDIENKGNTRSTFSAHIELYDQEGKLVQTINRNLGEVLPFSRVNVERPWDEPLLGDHALTAKAVITASGISETQKAEASFELEKKPVEAKATDVAPSATQDLLGNNMIKLLILVVIILLVVVGYLLRRII